MFIDSIGTDSADPYPALARLRAQARVHRLRVADGAPFWLLTGEADVRAALADPRLTVDRTNGARHGGFTLPGPLQDNLLSRDEAGHVRLRRFAAASFSARRTETLRERIRDTAEYLVTRLAARERADLVTDFAIPLPLTVAADLLGVPASDRPALAARRGRQRT